MFDSHCIIGGLLEKRLYPLTIFKKKSVVAQKDKDT